MVTGIDDWWSLATSTIPLLKDYAESFDIKFDSAEANYLLDMGDHNKLHEIFEDLHEALPDNTSIRRRPFFDLCDLCSEYWVFELDADDTE